MSYEDLLDNLGEFIDECVSITTLRKVADTIGKMKYVLASGLLPFKFYAVWKELPTDTPQFILNAVSKATDYSCQSIKKLSGKNVVLVDLSEQMFYKTNDEYGLLMSERSSIYASVLARSGSIDVYAFSDRVEQINIPKDTPVLAGVSMLLGWHGKRGESDLEGCLAKVKYAGYDNVIILQDNLLDR